MSVFIQSVCFCCGFRHCTSKLGGTVGHCVGRSVCLLVVRSPARFSVWLVGRIHVSNSIGTSMGNSISTCIVTSTGSSISTGISTSTTTGISTSTGSSTTTVVNTSPGISIVAGMRISTCISISKGMCVRRTRV